MRDGSRDRSHGRALLPPTPARHLAHTPTATRRHDHAVRRRVGFSSITLNGSTPAAHHHSPPPAMHIPLGTGPLRTSLQGAAMLPSGAEDDGLDRGRPPAPVRLTRHRQSESRRGRAQPTCSSPLAQLPRSRRPSAGVVAPRAGLCRGRRSLCRSIVANRTAPFCGPRPAAGRLHASRAIVATSGELTSPTATTRSSAASRSIASLTIGFDPRSVQHAPQGGVPVVRVRSSG